MRTLRPAFGRRQQGLSLIELMISVTIGLLIILSLLELLANTARSNRAQFQAAQQIENGRYAIETVSADLRHAGFLGEFAPPASSLTALPDPCDTSLFTATPTIEASEANTASPLAFHVQGYRAASTAALPSIPTGCATWLNSTNVQPGSDILVVRRLDTRPLIDELGLTSTLCEKPSGTVSCTTAATKDSSATTNMTLYAQADNSMLYAFLGDGAAVDKTTKKNASFSSRKDFSGGGATDLAPYIRRVVTNIYFVSKCRRGSGANGACTTADDTVPTLKRLELGAGATGATFSMVSLVDGIEYFKVRYGIDAQDSAALTKRTTNKTYDGFADYLNESPSIGAAGNDWANVVSAEIRVIARNPDINVDVADTKTYDLGGGQTYAPSGTDAANYRRHLFTSSVYIMNAGGRREF